MNEACIVRSLTKSFSRDPWWRTSKRYALAVRGVSLSVQRGETLAIVGPSGSGKSTLARCIAGLEQPDSGEVHLGGPVQLIFQNAGASLNPRFTVANAIAEPLRVHRRFSRDEVVRRMEQVELPSRFAKSLASQLSGGEKARLAIARALAALGDGNEAALLIIDESLSNLDLSMRAQMINLLVDLQASNHLSYILITHEPDLANHMADETAKMSEGTLSFDA